MRYSRILVPTDLSRLGDSALEEALEHLKPSGRVLLLHVCEPSYIAVLGAGGEAPLPIYDEAATKRRGRQAVSQLRKLARRGRGRVEIKVVYGSRPAELIARAARAWLAQLVVMCTHGRTGLLRLWSGSVALKLLSLHRGRVLMLRPSRT